MKTIKVRKVINLKEKQFEEHFNASLIDISGGGICFSAAKEIDLHDLIEVNMELGSKAVTLFAKVLRKDYRDENNQSRFVYGVTFEKITEIERNIIMRFIFEEQRKLAKKGLI